jgi:hypothetical protein
MIRIVELLNSIEIIVYSFGRVLLQREFVEKSIEPPYSVEK